MFAALDSVSDLGFPNPISFQKKYRNKKDGRKIYPFSSIYIPTCVLSSNLIKKCSCSLFQEEEEKESENEPMMTGIWSHNLILVSTVTLRCDS